MGNTWTVCCQLNHGAIYPQEAPAAANVSVVPLVSVGVKLAFILVGCPSMLVGGPAYGLSVNVTLQVRFIVTVPAPPPVLVQLPVATLLDVSVITYVNAATQLVVAPPGFVAVIVNPFELMLPETFHLRY